MKNKNSIDAVDSWESLNRTSWVFRRLQISHLWLILVRLHASQTTHFTNDLYVSM